MANPFLVLGGIAISVATAAFGILQVPGWVASAQDASVINDLSNVRAVQAAAVSQTGAYVSDIGALPASLGISMNGEGIESISLETGPKGWCATAPSKSGAHFAASSDTTKIGSGASVERAKSAAGCEPCLQQMWTVNIYHGRYLAGDPAAVLCMDRLKVQHTEATAPAPGIDPINYSTRSSAVINDGAGTYDFLFGHDDGARVYIDDVLVYNAWDAGNQNATFTVELGPGPHKVVAEQWQTWQSARVDLRWTVRP